MSPPIVGDTGGHLRGLASTRDGQPSFPEYEKILTSASLAIVPGVVLGEMDYFLRENRVAVRNLVADIFDPVAGRDRPDGGAARDAAVADGRPRLLGG